MKNDENENIDKEIIQNDGEFYESNNTNERNESIIVKDMKHKNDKE